MNFFSNTEISTTKKIANNDNNTMGANTPAPSNCVIILLLKYPSPACAPSHSPIAAPITLSGTAILKLRKNKEVQTAILI